MKLSNSLAPLFRTLCHWYPLKSGCGTLANTSFLKALIPNESIVLTELSNGTKIYIYPNDYVGTSIYYFGDLDPKISWICRQILREGDIFVDVGANLGLLSLYAASLVGSTGQIHAVEPQNNLAALLQKSAAANGFNNIHIHPLALSDKEGILPLYIPDVNYGAASLSQTEYASYNVVEVPIKNASEFLRSLHLNKIKLLKIDVEGHEDALIRGAKPYLQENPPEAIIIEVHTADKPWFENESLKTLADLGYKLYAIPKSLFRVKLVPLTPDNPQKLMSNDYVAISESAFFYH